MPIETSAHLEQAVTPHEEATISPARLEEIDAEHAAARTQREQAEAASCTADMSTLACLDKKMQALGQPTISQQLQINHRAAEDAVGLIAGDARLAEDELRAATTEGKSFGQRAWHTVSGLAEIPVIGAMFKPLKLWKRGEKAVAAASKAATESSSLAIKGFPKLGSMSMREAWAVTMPELKKMKNPQLLEHADVAKENLHTSIQILRNTRDFIQEAAMNLKADKWGMSAEQVAAHANTMRETAINSIEAMLHNLRINHPNLYRRNMAKFDSLAQELYSINIEVL